MCNKKIFLITALVLTFSLPVKAQQKWSLDDCINYAKEHNIDVIKQKIRSRIFEKDVKIAKGNFLPDANFTASQNFFLGNFLNLSTGVNQSKSSSNFFSLSSSWNIFSGLLNKNTLDRSKNMLDKASVDLENIRFDLTMNITVKYLDVLYNKDILKVAEDQVEISNQNFERLKQLYAKGLTTKRELLEIESTLASDKKGVVVAQNNVENSLIDLKELLDIKDIPDFDVKPLDDQAIDANLQMLQHVPEEAIVRNPLIRSYQSRLDIQQYNINISKSYFFPKIYATYSLNTNYYRLLDDPDFINDENNSFQNQIKNNLVNFIGISAVVPIFNRFSSKGNLKKAEFEWEIAKNELHNRKNILRNKIQKAMNDVETAVASLKAAEVAYKTQQQAFELAQINYKNGTISSYDFLNSKTKLILTTSSYIKAKFDLFFKQSVLQYYLNV